MNHSQESTEIKQKLLQETLYPVSELYRKTALAQEFDQKISYGDITGVLTALLKFVSCILIRDYYQYLKEENFSSPTTSRAILDYLEYPDNPTAWDIIRLIQEDLEKNNKTLSVPRLDYISSLEPIIQELLDLEYRMTGSFLDCPPPSNPPEEYLGTIQELLSRFNTHVSPDIRIPIVGMEYNSFNVRGIYLTPENFNFHQGMKTQKKFNLTPIITTTGATGEISLEPLLYLKRMPPESPSFPGRLMFLHRSRPGSYFYLDLTTMREVEVQDLEKSLIIPLSEMFKSLQGDASAKKKKPYSPIPNYKDMFAYYKKRFVGREEILRDMTRFLEGPGGKIGIIKGKPGRGKTALVSRFLSHLEENPEGNFIIIPYFLPPFGEEISPQETLLCLSDSMKEMLPQEKSDEVSPREQDPLPAFEDALTETLKIAEEKKKKLLIAIDSILSPEELIQSLISTLHSIKEERLRQHIYILLTAEEHKGALPESAVGLIEDLPPLSEDEVAEYLEEFYPDASPLAGKIMSATYQGEPMMLSLLTASLMAGEVPLHVLPEAIPEIIGGDQQEPRTVAVHEGDPYYFRNILDKIYNPTVPQDSEGDLLLIYDILGVILLLNHPVSDHDLAKLFRRDISVIVNARLGIGKFLCSYDQGYSFCHKTLKDLFTPLYNQKDIIRLHKKIIEFYEERSIISGTLRRDCKSMSNTALLYLPHHYYRLGSLTGDWTGLFVLMADDDFRLEQGLRLGYRSILMSLKKASEASIEKDDIRLLMKFGFLYNEVKSGGARGGLSIIVSQTREGNIQEAMELVRKIPDETLQYRLMLMLSWYVAKRDDYLESLDVLEEALLLPSASFTEEDESWILKIVEDFIQMGIAEGLDILKTGIPEERTVRYYSRLAGTLAGKEDLIKKIATGASMQLRKISDEKLKSRFVEEFARIIVALKDEIKKRQFFENLIYEARNLEDQEIRYITLTSLAEIYSVIDKNRSYDLIKSILEELNRMETPRAKFKIGANLSGKVAKLGNHKWSYELFESIITQSEKIPDAEERADVFQEIAMSLVNIENPGKRAEFLEKIFSISEKSFNNLEQQAKVMVGISQVIGTDDEDLELLDIYRETFSYINELPVDVALRDLELVAPNMKVVRDPEVYDYIMDSGEDLINSLTTPEEKSRVFKAIARGLSGTSYLAEDLLCEHYREMLDSISSITGYESEIYRGDALGYIGSTLTGLKIPQRHQLLTETLQKASALMEEKARAKVFSAIGRDLYKIGIAAEMDRIYELLESAIHDLKSSQAKGEALLGLSLGCSRIGDKFHIERLKSKIVYLAENLDNGEEIYRVLTSFAGGLLVNGEERSAIDLFEKALSFISLSDETAAESPGGVIAGICRSIILYSDEEWAKTIYNNVLTRIDHISPETKKVEALIGIIDSLSSLADKERLKQYYRRLINVSDNLINPRLKIDALEKLAHSFSRIGENSQAQQMWERVITITASLPQGESEEYGAKAMGRALVDIFHLEGDEWKEEAFRLLMERAEKLSPDSLACLLETVFRRLDNISQPSIQTRLIETLIPLAEKQENPDQMIHCITAISEGIRHLSQGRLLKEILDRLVQVIKGIKKGTYRVQAMAIVSGNFLILGLKEWAEKAYQQIDNAYRGLKDNNVRAVLLGEMLQIPLYSDDANWQESLVTQVFEKELPTFDEKNQMRVLRKLGQGLTRCKRKKWARNQMDKLINLLKGQGELQVYKTIFAGLAESGDVETLLYMESHINNPHIKGSFPEFLQDALLQIVKNDVRQAMNYFEKISEEDIKINIAREYFSALMEHRDKFPQDKFREYYKNLLITAIQRKDVLDFCIGKILPTQQDSDIVEKIARELGLTETFHSPSLLLPEEKAYETVLITAEDLSREKIIEGEAELLEGLDRKKGGLFASRKSVIKPRKEPPSPQKTIDKKAEIVLDQPQEHPEQETVIDDNADVSEFLKYGYSLVKSQYFGEAIKYFKKAMEQYPNDSRGYIGMAVTSYIMRDYIASAKYYVKAQEVNPEADNMERFLKGIPRNTYIWYDFAKCLYDIKEYDETLKFCERIKAEGVYFDFGKKVDALREDCINAKNVKPESKEQKNIKIYVLVGIVIFGLLFLRNLTNMFNYFLGERYIKMAREAVEDIDRGRPYEQAHVYEKYGHFYLLAIDQLERVNSPGLVELGFVKKARFQKAVAMYELARIIRLNEEWQMGDRLKPGELDQAYKYRQDAVNIFSDIIRKDRTDYNAYYYRGLCYLDFAMDPKQVIKNKNVKIEDYFGLAISDLKKVREIHPDMETHLQFAMANVETFIRFQGIAYSYYIDDAAESLERAYSIKPDARITAYMIACKALKGKTGEAQELADKARLDIKSQYSLNKKQQEYWLRKIDEFLTLK